MPTPTYTKSGTVSTNTVKLDKTVFSEVAPNHELLKSAYVAYLANGRENLAVTKTRGLVSGGGKKPWKQKGTGRARFGSSRVPIWRGGGVVFGPTGLENYKKYITTSEKRKALKQALSLAVSGNKLIIIDELANTGKTSEMAKLLSKIKATRNTLVVVDHKTAELTRSVNNLDSVKLVQAKYLNVYDLLNADSLVVTKPAITAITDWLGGK
jgi:large subunit ribosomal protein L4